MSKYKTPNLPQHLTKWDSNITSQTNLLNYDSITVYLTNVDWETSISVQGLIIISLPVAVIHHQQWGPRSLWLTTDESRSIIFIIRRSIFNLIQTNQRINNRCQRTDITTGHARFKWGQEVNNNALSSEALFAEISHSFTDWKPITNSGLAGNGIW